MKRGFTLVELLVVIIIIGILATLGFTQYTKVIEKGRSAEAKNNLGMLRKLQLANYQEKEAYATTDDLGAGLPTGTGGACATSADGVGISTNFYFGYSCDTTSGTCTAGRCTSGGKIPKGLSAYKITLDKNGNWGGDEGWY